MSSPIDDVRAMLAQFLKSPLRDLHFRTGGWEMFFARDGGGQNPMRATTPASAGGEPVTAPHLGLFTASRAVGDSIAAGETIGQLAVLDEVEDIPSDRAGRIVAIAADAGSLVEYGDALVLVG